MSIDEDGMPDTQSFRCVICKGRRKHSEGIFGGGMDWLCHGCNYGLKHGLDPLSADTHQRAYLSRSSHDS